MTLEQFQNYWLIRCHKPNYYDTTKTDNVNYVGYEVNLDTKNIKLIFKSQIGNECYYLNSQNLESYALMLFYWSRHIKNEELKKRGKESFKECLDIASRLLEFASDGFDDMQFEGLYFEAEINATNNEILAITGT